MIAVPFWLQVALWSLFWLCIVALIVGCATATTILVAIGVGGMMLFALHELFQVVVGWRKLQ